MTFFVAFLDHEGGSASQQVGGKLIILRIWKKLSQPKSVQFWMPMGMPSWQVQKNLGVCLALWRLGGCLCLQKVNGNWKWPSQSLNYLELKPEGEM